MLKGTVGAGTGARAGGLKGGVGSASLVLDDGTTVARRGGPTPSARRVDPLTGELYAARFGIPGELPQLEPAVAGRAEYARETADYARGADAAATSRPRSASLRSTRR